ncbi:MAG: trehalase family glycosidase [Dehalococcoidales bacterium]|jgi:glycogen debranching enzyme
MSTVKSARTYSNIPQLVTGCYALLESLEVSGTSRGKHYHTYRPALTKYGPYQWLWDSGWHMIVWSYRQRENAIADLRTLLQFQQPDGFIPEIIFWRRNRFLGKLANFITGYSHQEFTDLTQMPMLAYSVRAIWQATHDKKLLQEFVPKIMKYLEWWCSRDHDNDGLVSIIHPWESGIDASPTYDPVFHLSNPRPFSLHLHFWKLLWKYRRVGWNQTTILQKEWFNVEDVGVCSVYADGWGVLAALAGEFDNELANRCREQYRRYQEAIIHKCWDEERGQFVSYFHQNGAEIASRAETIQTLLPLLLDDLPADIQQKLVARIKDPGKFWLPYPVPSVARCESEFNPNECGLLWRGPMWPSMTWLVMEGLIKHGFQAEAAAILDRWSELYLQNGIWEYYNPLTGKGLGQKLGMSTIIVDMLERFGRV